MVQLGRDACPFQTLQPPAKGAPGLGPWGRGRPSVRGLTPVAHTHCPGAHSWLGTAAFPAFPREPRLVPGWSPGVGQHHPCPALKWLRPAPRCGRWGQGGRAAGSASHTSCYSKDPPSPTTNPAVPGRGPERTRPQIALGTIFIHLDTVQILQFPLLQKV